MNESTIQMIPLYQLFPHPDNPRKDLGDLTELIESVRKNGILQNLTVVPKEDENGEWDPDAPAYTVIIGHRRLAAAKQAGVLELPCIVKNMSKAEQFNTMMEENMQRSDLTPIEQADGFQYMLDLGQTKDQISERTGFSKTTIDRRLKLRQLDRKKVKAAEERGATLFDYMELFKIDDKKKRDDLLDSIGTRDFRNNFEFAYQEQENAKRKKEIVSVVKTFAKRFPKGKENKRWSNDYDQVKSYQLAGKEEVQVPDDGREYFFFDGYGSVEIYTKAKKPDCVLEYEAWFRQRKKELDDTFNRHAQLQKDFWSNLSERTLEQKENKDILMTWLVECISGYCIPYTGGGNMYSMSDFFKTFFDWESSWQINKPEDYAPFQRVFEKEPYRMALLAIIGSFEETSKPYAEVRVEYKYSAKYPLNKFAKGWRIRKLQCFYDFLQELGYEASTEELDVLNGKFFDRINDGAPELPVDGKKVTADGN